MNALQFLKKIELSVFFYCSSFAQIYYSQANLEINKTEGRVRRRRVEF